MSIQKGQGAVLMGVVQSNPLLKVLLGRDELSALVQALSQRPVPFQEESGVLHALGQGEQLLPELLRCLELRPYEMERPHPVEYREELRRLPDLSAQLPRAAVNSS